MRNDGGSNEGVATYGSGSSAANEAFGTCVKKAGTVFASCFFWRTVQRNRSTLNRPGNRSARRLRPRNRYRTCLEDSNALVVLGSIKIAHRLPLSFRRSARVGSAKWIFCSRIIFAWSIYLVRAKFGNQHVHASTVLTRGFLSIFAQGTDGRKSLPC